MPNATCSSDMLKIQDHIGSKHVLVDLCTSILMYI